MENARPCPLWVLLAMLITMLVSSPELGAQAIGPDGVCEVGRVTNIVVDNRPIFQLETLEEDSPLRWVYRLCERPPHNHTPKLHTERDPIRRE